MWLASRLDILAGYQKKCSLFRIERYTSDYVVSLDLTLCLKDSATLIVCSNRQRSIRLMAIERCHLELLRRMSCQSNGLPIKRSPIASISFSGHRSSATVFYFFIRTRFRTTLNRWKRCHSASTFPNSILILFYQATRLTEIDGKGSKTQLIIIKIG